jgi:malonyl-CoA O-methyltransferase
MQEAAALSSTRRAVDDAALARVRSRIAAQAQGREPAWLHAEAARRMAPRLVVLRRPPQRVIDWQGDSSGSGSPLRLACPRAEFIRVEQGGAAPARMPWWQRWRGPSTVDASVLPEAAGDLLWSNMGLHWCSDPLAEMRRWQRALEVNGILMFSTLGPGSLLTLRELYGMRGWGEPFADFVDMHDLGDMLVQAGFADPVMDQETLRLSWASGAALLAELRQWGANVKPNRQAGLRTPRWRRELIAALESASVDGRPALDVELVYGHAVRQRARMPVAPETRVALGDMRSILRGGDKP